MMKVNSSTFNLIDVIRFLWDRLGTRKGIFIIGIILNFSQAFSMMLDPLFTSLLISKLEIRDFSSVPFLAVGLFILILILSSLSLFSEYIKLNTIFGLNTSLMFELADKSQRISLEEVKEIHSSDLLQRITYDTPRSTHILTIIFDKIIDQMLMLILAAIYLLWVNWVIAICVLCISPCMLIITYFLQNKLQRVGNEIAVQESRNRQVQQDSLQAIEVIKTFGVSDWFINRFVKERECLNQLYIKRMWLFQWINLFTTFVSNFVIISIILILGFLYIDHSLALSSMIVYFTLVWRVNTPMKNIGELWGQIQESFGSVQRVFDLISMPNEPSSLSPTKTNELGVKLENVSYYYSFEEQILTGVKNIDLNIRNGEHVVITGPSGSGKSTLCKLLSGLLFASDGNVNIIGLNPKEDAISARNQVAYSSQFPIMFSVTIKENLLMYNTNFETEMIRIAKLLKIDEFINSLPDGFETVLQEKGKSLSGGQIQRLAIARAILSNRPIWIFDEVTSALDLDTEKDIIRAIISEAKLRGSTVVFIAHRLTAYKDLDRVIVLKDGVITQSGTHEELLMEKESLYQQLWLVAES